MVEPKGKQIQRYAGANLTRIENAPDDERQKFEQLCLACRNGDLEVVEKLLTSGEASINAVDQYDNSPLFLAALCGKEEVVRYLLHQGALCDRDTFQGERCIYGALNDKIRNLLLSFDISKSVDILQPFAAWISAFLYKPLVECSDFEVEVGNQLFRLHKFIIQVRCPSLLEHDLSQIDQKSLLYIIRHVYLYEQYLPSNPEDVDNLIKCAKLFGLTKLVNDIEESQKQTTIKEKSRTQQRQRKAETLTAQKQFNEFLENNIIANGFSELNDDLLEKIKNATSPDVLLQVEIDNDNGDDDNTVYYYAAHKAILVRSEYFEAMFCSQFTESQEGLPIVSLPVSSLRIAKLTLEYLYTDKVEIPIEIAMDVMYDSDMLLLDKLKNLAALTIIREEDQEQPHSIYSVIRAAWTLRIVRLEYYAARYIADNFDRYIKDPEFGKIVVESANRMNIREETDTIELIDDIRYFLAKRYGIFFDDDLDADETNQEIGRIEDTVLGISPYERQYNHRLDLIDELLASLDLQA